MRKITDDAGVFRTLYYITPVWCHISHTFISIYGLFLNEEILETDLSTGFDRVAKDIFDDEPGNEKNRAAD